MKASSTPNCELPVARAMARWKARSSSTPSRPSATAASIALSAASIAAMSAGRARSAASAATSPSSARRTSTTSITAAIESSTAGSNASRCECARGATYTPEPCLEISSPCERSRLTASRTTVRDTPYCADKAGSVGSGRPGFSSPRSICECSKAARRSESRSTANDDARQSPRYSSGHHMNSRIEFHPGNPQGGLSRSERAGVG